MNLLSLFQQLDLIISEVKELVMVQLPVTLMSVIPTKLSDQFLKTKQNFESSVKEAIHSLVNFIKSERQN